MSRFSEDEFEWKLFDRGWSSMQNSLIESKLFDKRKIHFTRSMERGELRTMKLVHGKRDVRDTFSAWISRLKPRKNPLTATELRENGNTELKKNKNFFLCAKLYTEALYAAGGNSEETALCHANRAYVLMQLGRFKEAYDDCECCLMGDYPKSRISKIILRQADCALNLNDINKMEMCLEKLKMEKRSDPEFEAMNKLTEKLQTLKYTSGTELKEITEGDSSNISKEKKQVLCNAPQRGRFVVTGETVQKDEMIMQEEAYAFVPVFCLREIQYFCQGCADTPIIPFPCYECREVSYCSIKCRQDHAIIHSFECPGYKKSIFPEIGVAYLALRTLLVGFSGLHEHLKNLQSPEEIWDEIIAFSDKKDNRYGEVIGLSANFDKMHLEDYLRYALAASFLTTYLNNYTTFFSRIVETLIQPKYTNWEIVFASLLLRHIGQMVSNAHTITGITFDPFAKYFWKYGDLPKLGSLHELEYKEVFTAIYPRVSLYNHCCKPNFRNKFNKSILSVIAATNLQEGTEIFNCYGAHFKKMCKEERQLVLRSQHCFECDCKHCKGDDEEYKKYHKYRCTNIRCKKLFTPEFTEMICWDNLEEGSPDLKCTYCKNDFEFSWLDIFTTLIANPSLHRKRNFLKAYQIYKTSHVYLEGPHQVKEKMCWLMLRDCTDLYYDSVNSLLLEIAEDLLLIIEEKSGFQSMEFVEAAAFYLDLLAIKACEPNGLKSNYDLNKIQSSFEILSDKMKSIFRNYVNQYILSSCVNLMQDVTISDCKK